VTSGFRAAQAGTCEFLLTTVTDPPASWSSGNDPGQGAKALEAFGLRQVRKGDVEDDAISWSRSQS